MNALSFYDPQHDDSAQRLAYKQAKAIAVGMGLSGNDIVEDTTKHDGQWWCLHALNECVFTAVVFANGTSTGSLAGKTLAKGDRIYGRILSFTLASGVAIAYRGSL